MTPGGLIDRPQVQVIDAAARCGFAPRDLLIVAVSGGPDSLALLHALARTRRETSLGLHVAHLDHGLRGEESEADAAFVSKTCRGLGIDLTSDAVDTGAYRRAHRLSLEDAARRLRYGFLARVAAAQGARAVALGHTLDDQAETVLMNIVRGTGLTGLRGMSESTTRTIDGADVLLFRPFLHGVSRSDTEGYCEALGLEPRHDSSNSSSLMLRNRIRREVMPSLASINPQIRDAVLRLSAGARRDLDHVERSVDAAWADVVDEQGASTSIDRAAFAGLDDSIGAHLLRRVVGLAADGLSDLELGHVDEMLDLLKGPAGRSLDLPGGLVFSVGYRTAQVGPPGLDACPLPPLENETELAVPGETAVGAWRVVAEVGGDPGDAQAGAISASIRSSAAGGGLRVRGRRPGDRFQPQGMAGTKKLQDFMVDSRIDRSWRDRIPLVVGEDGIAWVVGWRLAEWARPSGTGDDVRLCFIPQKDNPA